LAIDIGNDPLFQDAIEKLTKALPSGVQDIGECAGETAEAELDLLRIRNVRSWLFERFHLADTALPHGLSELNDSLANI
jgi:hypothetical protein